MDELISIIQQRRTQLNTTISNTEQKHKSELIQHQRKRIQRQNWILRVVKTIKMPVLQQKKIIIQTILKVMSFFKPIEPPIDNIQHTNFTQTVINLFVQFYNKFEDMDLTHIRTIIRPNNYIIVDLLKSVIDLSRKQFKTFIQEHFKEVLSSHRLEFKPVLKAKAKTQDKTSRATIEMEEQINLQQKLGNKIHKKILTSLVQKYNKSIDSFNVAAAHQRFNTLYFDLLYLNHKNAHRIQKYMDSCFGAKRHINYDATGLYTVEEIKNIKRERQERATNRIADLKDLKQNCTTEQLKEHFKMKVQLHECINSFPCFRKVQTIRTWFPIACVKNGDKLHPYNLMVEVNGSNYTEAQFQEKYNKKLKNHMKDLLMEEYSNKSLFGLEDQQMVMFDKKSYLDYNNSKILQLMTKEIQSKFYNWQSQNQRQKSKQRMFPPISSCSSVDLTAQGRPNRNKSETKLPNASMVMYRQKEGIGLKQILQKRLNYSSFVKDMEVSKRNMNSIIGNILRHDIK